MAIEIPSMKSAPAHRGWSYALGEAIKLGVPVLGIEVGGIGELLSPIRQDYLQASRDHNELAKRIELFLNDYSNQYKKYFEMFENS